MDYRELVGVVNDCNNQPVVLYISNVDIATDIFCKYVLKSFKKGIVLRVLLC